MITSTTDPPDIRPNPKPKIICTLRGSQELHQRLKAAAREEHVSVNYLVQSIMACWLADRAQPPAAQRREPGPAQPKSPEEKAAEFSRRFPKGTQVYYHPVMRRGQPACLDARPTWITSEAFAAASGEVVVFVEGVRGYVSCAHITPRVNRS